MPKKRLTNEQIAFTLRQAENGMLVGETVRERVLENSGIRLERKFKRLGHFRLRQQV